MAHVLANSSSWKEGRPSSKLHMSLEGQSGRLGLIPDLDMSVEALLAPFNISDEESCLSTAHCPHAATESCPRKVYR